MALITIFITLVFLHSLVSVRPARTVVTAPIVFTTAGMLTVLAVPELQAREGGLEAFLRVAEYLEQTTHQPGDSAIWLAVMMTVLLSIFAHGLSAKPGIELYARKLRTLPPQSPELESDLDLLSHPSTR